MHLHSVRKSANKNIINYETLEKLTRAHSMQRENGNFTDIRHLQNFHFIRNDDKNQKKIYLSAIDFISRGEFHSVATEKLYANVKLFFRHWKI